jgi:hypothetical protein
MTSTNHEGPHYVILSNLLPLSPSSDQKALQHPKGTLGKEVQENLKEEDLHVNGRIILKRILKKHDGRV